MLTLIKHARVLTMDDDDTEYLDADILIRDSKIEAIGEDIAAPAGEEPVREIDARGKLVMPGVINAHFHSSLNLFKGVHAGPLGLFIMHLYGIEKDSPKNSVDPALLERASYVTTALGNIEMLRHGVTGVIEDAHYFPITQAAIDGTLNAYIDSGLRATVSLAQTDQPDYKKMAFVEDLLPEAVKADMDQYAAEKPLEQILDNFRSYIDQWHGKGENRIHTSVSISAPERCTDEMMTGAGQIASDYGVVFDSHVLEAKYQRVLSEQRWGKSAIAHMEDLGLLNERVHLNHAIWVDDNDIDLLAKRGCAVSHNIHCNLDAGSGIMPFRKMYNAGIPIGIGTDEVDADGTCNPWGVAKTANFAQHATDPDWLAWCHPDHLLKCLTRGGARGMNRHTEVGMLAPSYKADLIMLDLSSISFVPLRNLRIQLLLSDIGRSVVMTMIDGNIVMENGLVENFDQDEIFAEAMELAKFVGSEAPSPTVEALFPTWREAQLRAEDTDVGFNRLLRY